MIDSSPLVSVNIPTLNSSLMIGKCIAAIQKQTYKNIEIIVIDSHSQDDTVNIALNKGVKIFYKIGLFHQRLLGIKKSKGKYILLLDSDQVLEETAIEKCVILSETNKKPLGIILNEISKPVIKGPIATLQAEYVQLIHTGDWDPILGTALPRFFPVNLLKELNPLPREIGYFDHLYIYNKMVEKGLTSIFSKEAIVYHYERNMPIKMLKKFYKYYGFYIIPALIENPKLIMSRLMPRRKIFSNTASKKNAFSQLLLYGAKSLASGIGIISYVIQSIIIVLKDLILPSVDKL